MSSLQMMLTTRKISTAMTLNGLVYFCQKIPVIGKAVPDTLYGLYGAKTVWVILANLARLMKRLLTKAIYLGSLLASSYFCAVITGGDKNYNVFTDTGRIMTFFFFFSYLAAALAFGKALNLDLGTDLLMIDKMHSDAGKYVPARIYERKIIDFFATIPLAIVLSFSDQYTLWQALLAVFLMTASKLAFESAVLLCFAIQDLVHPLCRRRYSGLHGTVLYRDQEDPVLVQGACLSSGFCDRHHGRCDRFRLLHQPIYPLSRARLGIGDQL